MYVLKMSSLICVTIFTIYSLDHATRRDFDSSNDYLQICHYSHNDRKGSLPDWMQEDDASPKVELIRFGATSFKGPFAPSDYHLDIKQDRLHLESRANAGRLRLVQITTSDDKTVRIYLSDGDRCSSKTKGTIFEKDYTISSVNVLTLRGNAHW